MQVSTKSTAETQKFATEIAKKFKERGGIILLSGNLGAGKTTFTQGFIRSFGITQHIISPTFLLVKQYQIPSSERWIFHLDLYRLAEPINLSSTGIKEIIDSRLDNIILIEWSEKIKDQLNNLPYTEINLEKSEENQEERIISVVENL